MRKAFFINLVILIGLNLLIKPLYVFGIDVQVQNALGPQDYGLFFSYYNLILLFHFILEFGLPNLVKSHISDQQPMARPYLKAFTKLKALLTVFFGILLIVVWWLADYPRDTWWVLAGNLTIHILMSFLVYFRAFLSSLGHYRTDSILSVMDKGLMIIVLGLFLYSPLISYFDLSVFIFTYIVSLIIAVLVAICLTFRAMSALPFTVAQPDNKLLLQQTVPFALTALLTGIFGRIDVVLLERMVTDGTQQAGIYAGGYRLLDAYLMFALLFSNLLVPMLAAKKNDQQQSLQLFRFVLGLMLSISLPAAIGGYFFREEIMVLLYARGDNEWTLSAGLLFLAMLPMGAGLIFGASIISTGKVRQINLFLIVLAVFNILLDIILIPRYGAVGAACVLLIVNSTMCLGQWVIYYLIIRQRPSIKMISQTIASGVATLGIMYMLVHFGIQWHWMSRLTLGVILSLGITVLTGLIQVDFQRWKMLLKK